MASQKRPRRKVSIVIPIYNEADGLAIFLKDHLLPSIKKMQMQLEFEVILVDDGSVDNSLEIAKNFAIKYPNIKIVALSRNFGKEIALTAGLRQSTGHAVIMLDSDNQQPPEIIPEFIQKWTDGAEVVMGIRSRFTKHGFIQKVCSSVFYKLMRAVGGKYVIANSTDFCLLDRSVVLAFNRLQEHNRITRGLIGWLGFQREYLVYTYGVRMAGKPSYNLRKLKKLAIDSLVSMSNFPLKIFSSIGKLLVLFPLIFGSFIFADHYLFSDRWNLYFDNTSLIILCLFFLTGVILMSHSATAIYVSRIHEEVQKRPLYVINYNKSVGIDENK